MTAHPTETRTIFITGGNSGIGEGLARAFHARGHTVIIGGRDAAALARVARECAGMRTQTVDVASYDSIARCAETLAAEYPRLDTLVNNAGVQRLVDFSSAPVTRAEMEVEIATNLQGLVYMTNAFLPLLQRQKHARLVNVTSGLAFVPLVRAPLYSASKAAVRAFTIALREQLRGSTVRVIELIPPIVATALHRDQTDRPARAMPLDVFVARAMVALDSTSDELPIGLAAVLRLMSRVAPRLFLKIVNGARGSAVRTKRP